MGFWRNTNGQTLISAYCQGNTSSAADNLARFLLQFEPFQDLDDLYGSTADKTLNRPAGILARSIATYVKLVVDRATGSDMNYMLKAQMLATALDVYFTDQALGWTTVKKSGKKPPSTFLPKSTLGDAVIDLNSVCVMWTTSGVCSGAFRDVSAAFGGADAPPRPQPAPLPERGCHAGDGRPTCPARSRGTAR